MTVSSALPSWMPFGGQSLTAGTYNTIARPLGIVYLFILAVCPLLSWGKDRGQAVLAARPRAGRLRARAVRGVDWRTIFTYLLPSYDA